MTGRFALPWRGALSVIACAALMVGCSAGSSGPSRSAPAPAPAASGPGSTTVGVVSFPSGTPRDAPVSKLLVFVVENHSLAQMQESMPTAYALAEAFGYADNYSALTHPSLPNYIAMISGDLHGVTDDEPPEVWQLTGQSVFGRAVEAGRTARLYAEAMPEPCLTQDAYPYAVRHNPWAYFVDERSLCQEHDVPFDEIDGDIVDGDLPDIGMVIPDVCHDAHDCPLRQADAWFTDELQKIVDGPDWRSGQLAVVLTADEDDGGDDNRVLTVVIHPSQQGHVTSEPLTHYSLHQLFLDVLGLPAELDDPSMADAFGLPIAPAG